MHSTGTIRLMFRLALPVLAEETLNLLIGYTDWWLTSRYLPETAYKAAMGLMAYITWLIPCWFAAAAIGATALIARSVGAGQREEASRATNQAILIGLLLAVVATVAAWLGGRAFIGCLQLRGTSADLAARYLDILQLAIPLIMVEQVGSACLRGAGDTVAGLLAKLVAVVVNLVVSTTLVLGLGGLPRIGWEGLALGAACGHGVAGLMILAFLIRGRAGLQLRLRDLRPARELLGRLLRVGIPAGADILIVLGCHLAYLAIINRLGDADAAAHGLGLQIEALSYLPGSAFAVAAATVAGQFLGAGDPRRAARGAMAACLVGGGIMTAAGTVFYFGGQVLTTFFTGHWQDPTGLYAAALLRIVAVSAPSLAVTMILTGALRGAGDTVWPLIFTLAGLLCVRLPGACWLAWDTIPIPLLGLSLTGLGWGVAGAWCAMVADVVLRSVLVLIRFEQGGWKRIRV